MTQTATRDDVASLTAAALPHVTGIRRDLHRHPELGYLETRTSERVVAELKDLGIEHAAGLARGTGVIAHLPANRAGVDPASAPTIGLRADMDALPILEETGVEYASQTPGTMHACGHDGHTANLLGVARVLNQLGDRPNNVTLVFQPAEEGGGGGDAMCKDGAIDGSRLGKPVDLMYGLHGWPDMEVGNVATRVGPLLAGTSEFEVIVRGKGGHAAYPHNTVDPIVAAAQFIVAAQTIVARSVSPVSSAVITFGEIKAGHARNVIPDEAKLRGTIRTLSESDRTLVTGRFEEVAKGVGSAMGATIEVNWQGGYPVTHNDAHATGRFRRVAQETLGPGKVFEREQPTMGGEDFAYYGAHAKACFYVIGLKPIGAPSYPGLHTPTFDFNDDALETGVRTMVALALDERV
ncbi:MAG: M20 family metallopeptidase [Planctomycetota bacterium]